MQRLKLYCFQVFGIRWRTVSDQSGLMMRCYLKTCSDCRGATERQSRRSLEKDDAYDAR
jgi:hypothetical protein